MRSWNPPSAAFALILLVTAASAEGPERRAAPVPPELVKILGGAEAWGELASWRQHMLVRRYEAFQRAPAEKQARIREAGLKEWLVRPRERHGLRELPPELRTELDQLPRDVRRLATKLTFMRLRHLRRDRNLAMVPFDQRRDLFRRLHPEPFDRSAARKAHEELNRYVSRAMAAKVRRRWEKESKTVPEDQRHERLTQLVRETTTRDERAVTAQVRKELLRFRSRNPDQIRAKLARDAMYVRDKSAVFATPRQRELIRYALRPEQCPLLDPVAVAGAKPEDPAARKAWIRDFRVLARIDLLSEAGYPPQMVLHMAASTSAADLLRALKALRGHRPLRGNPEPRR